MINSFSGEYAFLSNFFPGDNSSLEHKFQAAKTNNPIEKAAIMATTTPGGAKRLGKTVELRHDWEEIKGMVMWQLVWKKFKDPQLNMWLLGTGEESLVEGNNWHDNFWGDCSCNRCNNTQGRNVLGLILMTVRLGLHL